MTSKEIFKKSYPNAVCKRDRQGWYTIYTAPGLPYVVTSKREAWAWAEACRKILKETP